MTDFPAFGEMLDGVKLQDIVARIWHKDHMVWKPEPKEITNRLGWLVLPETMKEKVPELTSFAGEVRSAGYRHVVLLGMGGASLGAEVLHDTLGSGRGYPDFRILDSTVPDWVAAVTEAIDPAHTIFLVSSKSGGTIETATFYRYFRGLVEQSVGKERAGRNFVAITDAGSSLAGLAEEAGFCRAFLNPEDVGGRYSVLSYFGLVPAALTGIDIKTILGRAEEMKRHCAADVPVQENPGAWLGALIGTFARRGKDKLTLVTSSSVGRFGLWLEQLIAESLGKDGTGIIPVMGEPIMAPEDYGEDRLFVYLRLRDDNNDDMDEAIERIRSSGQDVITLDLKDKYDIGAELFRWEFATAVAGAIPGINPFDQPDVQAAKDATGRVLQEFQDTGQLPSLEISESLDELMSEIRKGDYLAIMAFTKQMPELEETCAELRRKVMEKHRIATTFGYGPRLLHSTGQLHKGGPNTGLFLQVTMSHEHKIPVPGAPYTFDILADAQALGDLQTLLALKRRVVRIHLDSGDTATFARIVSDLA
ncbi:MAG: glucose-6-phosphate isomerase [Dehalococcoidia bacterium]|nr:glucose-6-phosphate isomerase [Dehalococcoidia bacterium]